MRSSKKLCADCINFGTLFTIVQRTKCSIVNCHFWRSKLRLRGSPCYKDKRCRCNSHEIRQNRTTRKATCVPKRQRAQEKSRNFCVNSALTFLPVTRWQLCIALVYFVNSPIAQAAARIEHRAIARKPGQPARRRAPFAPPPRRLSSIFARRCRDSAGPPNQ